MKKRWTALILAAALLLSSCAPLGQTEDPAQSTGSSLGDLSQPQADTSQGESTDDESSLPPIDPGPSWEEGRTLSVALPDNYNGLELPIQGATGYPSVELPLWTAVEDALAAREAVEAWEQAQEEARLSQEEAQAEATGGDTAVGQDDPAGGTVPADGTASAAEADQAVVQPQTSDPVQDAANPPAADIPSAQPADPVVPTDPGATESGTADPSSPEPVAPAGEAPAPSDGTQPVQEDPIPPEGTEPPLEEPGPDCSDPEVPCEEEPEIPTLNDGAFTLLPAGTPFTVLREEGEWWYIAVEADYYEDEEQTVLLHGELNGWVEHKYCMVNLPDVVPSILYDATNSYSSQFITCGRPIPEITGGAFYPGKTYNPRLYRFEYMMPVLYTMAKKLAQAQRTALSEGNTLVLYEGFRPLDLQTKVYRAMSALVKTDSEVKAAVSDLPWNISWFIAGGVANHQQGYAVDMGLAKVNTATELYTNGHRYVRVMSTERYVMPTPIHELSRAAATYTAPVAIFSTTAWQKAELTASMAASEPALGLQRYGTGAGLTPLASDWWHFNDLEAYFQVQDNLGQGDFTITSTRSSAPG